SLRFLTPVNPGDSLTVTLTAKQITPREDADYGEVRWDADVTNQNGESVAKYDVLTLVRDERSREEPGSTVRDGRSGVDRGRARAERVVRARSHERDAGATVR